MKKCIGTTSFFKKLGLAAPLLRNQRGVTLITVVGLLLMMVVAFAALFGSSYMTAGKAQLTNIANVSALAAVSGYVEAKPGQGDVDYTVRKTAALAKANLIANQNKMKGVAGGFGSMAAPAATGVPPWPPAPSDGPVLSMGRWYPTPNPSPGAAQDCSVYPCFKPNNEGADPTTQYANAAGVQVCTDTQTNPLVVPFVGKQKQCASSIATLKQRCVVFLLDASMSTTIDSHRPIIPDASKQEVDLNQISPTFGTIVPGTGVFRFVYPNMSGKSAVDSEYNEDGNNADFNPGLASLAFYRASSVEIGGVPIGGGIPGPGDGAELDSRCNAPATFTGDPFVVRERIFWCTMGGKRNSAIMSPVRRHYRSDYVKRTVPSKNGTMEVYVDSLVSANNNPGQPGTPYYWAPQPLGEILLAINAATRSMQQWQTGGDRVALIAFRGDIVSKIPNAGMTTDLEYLMQLTDFENRGTFNESLQAVNPERHPNALDMNWFPLATEDLTDSYTNIIKGFMEAIDTLKNSCPKNAEKSIVLFSDGLSSCARASDGVSTLCPNRGDPAYTRWQISKQANDQINGKFISNTSAQDPDNDDFNKPPIQKLLKQNGIRATTIITGDQAIPNTINRKGDDGHFLSHDEARGKGYSPGGPQANIYSLWYSGYYSTYEGMGEAGDPRPANYDPASWACLHQGEPGYACGAVNPQWAQLAMETGGYYCPLRPKCEPGVIAEHHCPQHAGCELKHPNNPGLCDNNTCYDQNSGTPHKLKDAVRLEGQELTCADFDQTKGEQAAACAVQTVGSNPYVLVENEPQ